MENNISVAIVEDHDNVRQGLVELVNNRFGFSVILDADNGKEFIEKLDKNNLPDVVLMDIQMPIMNGYETTYWLSTNYPDEQYPDKVNVIALTMFDVEDFPIIRMFKNGAKSFISKHEKPEVMKKAIERIVEEGEYRSRRVREAFSNKERGLVKELSEKEIEFLKFTCSEMTYKEIATEMKLTIRAIESQRESLFQKLNVKNRVGLAMFAIRCGLY